MDSDQDWIMDVADPWEATTGVGKKIALSVLQPLSLFGQHGGAATGQYGRNGAGYRSGYGRDEGRQ